MIAGSGDTGGLIKNLFSETPSCMYKLHIAKAHRMENGGSTVPSLHPQKAVGEAVAWTKVECKSQDLEEKARPFHLILPAAGPFLN